MIHSCERRVAVLEPCVDVMARRNARSGASPRRSIQLYARTAYVDAILGAAERLFSRTGYAEAKMADLAREAGVAVGTLYKHFRSKEEVFVSLAARGREEIFQALAPALGVADPVLRLRALLVAFFGYVEERGALFVIYAELGLVLESQVRSFGGEGAEQTYDKFLAVLEGVFRDAAAAGAVRSDVPVRLLAATFAGAMNATLFAWTRAHREYCLVDRADALVELFLEGAAPR